MYSEDKVNDGNKKDDKLTKKEEKMEQEIKASLKEELCRGEY
jgi:hypothetical protein